MLIVPRGCDNFERFSCILLKFVMHAANNQFSDKHNNIAAGYCRMCSTYICHLFSSVIIQSACFPLYYIY